jgi:phosphate:Na+ symporter
MKAFEAYQPFIKLIESLGDNTLIGAGVGALFTILVQFSSATLRLL